MSVSYWLLRHKKSTKVQRVFNLIKKAFHLLYTRIQRRRISNLWNSFCLFLSEKMKEIRDTCFKS